MHKHRRISRIKIRVVSGWDDLQKVMALRAAVFLGEGQRSYNLEFDGNDHHATHVLSIVDDEPAGCCRIRWFGDFAKPERLAVLPRFRVGTYGGRGVAYETARFAFDHCRRKGYRTIYGHAVEEVANFWARFGTKPIPGGDFEIEGYRCLAMAGVFELPQDALNLDSGHLVLVRQEGAWDVPGPLERPASDEKAA
jgi:predicted GNAT family N-acyltransferase